MTRYQSTGTFICRTVQAMAIIGILICFAGLQQVEAKPLTLTLFRLPDFSSQDPVNKAEAAVVRRFMEKYPDIKLKRGSGVQIAGPGAEAGPLMQIAGDVSPEVIYVNFRYSDTYIQNGYLKPLDEYMDAIPKEELMRRVPPAVLPVIYREGPDGKKHWWALPTSRLVRVLAYRRDLFSKAGLNPDDPPRNWDELFSVSRKITKPDDGHFGIGFVRGIDSSWDFVNLVWSAGGDVVARNAKGEWEPRFNTKATAEALYFYTKLCTSPVAGKDGKEYHGVASRDFGYDGVNAPGDPVAMTFMYLDDKLNVYQPEKLGYAPIPHLEGANSASEVNCAMMGIYAGTKTPELAKAAFKYISFLDSDEAQKIRVKIFIQSGFGKFVSPVFLERYGYKDYLKQVDKEWIRVYKDAMINGKPEPYGKNCSVIYRELSRPIEQALNDKKLVSLITDGNKPEAMKLINGILQAAQTETLKRMFNVVPPNILKLRQQLTVVFLIFAALAFATATAFLVRNFSRSAPSATPGQKKTFFAVLLILPAALSVLIWQYFPLIRGTIMAFQDYNVMRTSPFVGVANFSEILFDANFWNSVYVTLLYTGLYMIFAFISPIVLALLLTEVPRGKVLFRTIFYLPAVLSGLVVIFLWKTFYRQAGLLNTIINPIAEFLHLNALTVDWLSDPSLAMIAVLLPVVWGGMGPGCLIYLAALKTIPEEFYEAADVDGAGVIKKIFSITLPSIKMLIMINAVGAFIGAFMSSETIFAMSGGGPYTPYGATETVGLQLFYMAFIYLRFGVANAMAWVLGFMLIGFTMIQLKNLSRVEFKGGR